MSDYLTAISIVIALITWLLTYLKDRKDKIKAHTAEILAAFNTNESLATASYLITKYVNEGKKADIDNIEEDAELKIITILDYYEFICEMLFLSKIIDKKTLLQLRGRLMCRIFSVCELYIRQTRERQKRNVYESFERFVKRYEQQLSLPADAC